MTTDTGPRVGAALTPDRGVTSRLDRYAAVELRPAPSRGRVPAVTVRPG